MSFVNVKQRTWNRLWCWQPSRNGCWKNTAGEYPSSLLIMKSTTRSLYCGPYGRNRSSPGITTPSLCALAVLLFPRIGRQTQWLIVKLLNYAIVSRFGLRTVLKPGLRVTGHRVKDFGRVGSGRVTGQCDRPSVWPIFIVFFCICFVVSFAGRIRHFQYLIQSKDTQWLGQVTGSKASGSDRIMGQRFRPCSISEWGY